MQKGNTLIFLLVGIFSFCLAGGAYYLGTRKSATLQDTVSKQNPIILPSISPEQNNKPTPNTKPQNDETANWKAYADEKYGISLKYPQDWKFDLSYLTEDDTTNKSKTDLIKYPRRIDLRNITGDQDFSTISIDFEGIGSCINPSMTLIQSNFNGIKAQSYFFTNNINHDVYCFNNFDLKNLPKLMIGVSYPKKDQELTNKILSTFKFL